MKTNANGIRTPNPSTWPQYPCNERPRTPEESPPRYRIHAQPHVRVRMRDGVELACDVFRPQAPGGKFPALIHAEVIEWAAAQPVKATNTVLQGRGGSRLLLPVIPR